MIKNTPIYTYRFLHFTIYLGGSGGTFYIEIKGLVYPLFVSFCYGVVKGLILQSAKKKQALLQYACPHTPWGPLLDCYPINKGWWIPKSPWL
jgi:hypothetical protein